MLRQKYTRDTFFVKLVNLDKDSDFIGKSALKHICNTGVSRKQVGLVIETTPLPSPNTTFWSVSRNGTIVGKVTSAVYSPRLKKNIALAMVSSDCADIGTALEISTLTETFRAMVVKKPFFDPEKKIPSK